MTDQESHGTYRCPRCELWQKRLSDSSSLLSAFVFSSGSAFTSGEKIDERHPPRMETRLGRKKKTPAATEQQVPGGRALHMRPARDGCVREDRANSTRKEAASYGHKSSAWDLDLHTGASRPWICITLPNVPWTQRGSRRRASGSFILMWSLVLFSARSQFFLLAGVILGSASQTVLLASQMSHTFDWLRALACHTHSEVHINILKCICDLTLEPEKKQLWFISDDCRET